MSYYSEYISRRMNRQQIDKERKILLRQIAQIRNRDVLAFACTTHPLVPREIPRFIIHDDLMLLRDQISKLQGEALDIILVTEGGSGEAVEEIARLLRRKFQEVAYIIPDRAMSAGTILVMSGDEILMSPDSSLGPIDAQISHRGQPVSADAMIKGVERIKKEADNNNNKLNAAYYPILANVSPADIEQCLDVQAYGSELVAKWLEVHKFKGWLQHSSDGRPVTQAERESRATEIASRLSDHTLWKTHGRCIKMSDLLGMGLQITDYSQNQPLCEAIQRYYTLLRITFEATTVYKLLETPKSQLYQDVRPVQQDLLRGAPGKAVGGDVDAQCGNCGAAIPLQVDFVKNQPLRKGRIKFPKDNVVECPNCQQKNDLTAVRRSIEQSAGRPIMV